METLSSLIQLRLSDNEFTGIIPIELSSLSNLEYLSLSGNQLTGPIPPELGRVINLETLHLSGNQLSGGIPSELGTLAELETLVLSNNQLTGSIPSELGRLSNLQQLRLRGNQLTGCIPAGLREISENDLGELGLPFCDCSNAGAVSDAVNNPGLVSDCDALLEARDKLAGSATLNWSAHTPVREWEDVGVSGSRCGSLGFTSMARGCPGNRTARAGQSFQPENTKPP